jgi:hypothetical protein
MTLSLVDPFNAAVERASRVCFRPFDMGKWFTIGFCAFLAGLAEGGVSAPNFNFNLRGGGGGGPGGGGGTDPRQAIDWLEAHLALILVVGLIVLVAVIALGALFTWLGSRGEFLFIDNVARNRGAVVAPWREYRNEGNSVFWFRFLFGLAVLAAFIIVIGGGGVIALADIQARRFGPAAGTGLAVGLGGFLVVALVSGVINLFLTDFVVPIAYLRRLGVMAAWREFRVSMLAGHAGTFVLYVLFKIVIAIGVGLVAALLTCCTLCIAAIPYVGTHVLLLPLHVFQRSYSLHFIEQFGPQWQVFSRADMFDAEFVEEEGEWPDERFRPADERFRPADDSIRPPDDDRDEFRRTDL